MKMTWRERMNALERGDKVRLVYQGQPVEQGRWFARMDGTPIWLDIRLCDRWVRVPTDTKFEVMKS
jgi:hypothetical protein